MRGCARSRHGGHGIWGGRLVRCESFEIRERAVSWALRELRSLEKQRLIAQQRPPGAIPEPRLLSTSRRQHAPRQSCSCLHTRYSQLQRSTRDCLHVENPRAGPSTRWEEARRGKSMPGDDLTKHYVPRFLRKHKWTPRVSDGHASRLSTASCNSRCLPAFPDSPISMPTRAFGPL
jgi:hypothetical protein